MDMRERDREWCKELRELLDTADGMLSRLQEGDGLFLCYRDTKEEYSGKSGKWTKKTGAQQSILRVTKIERVKNSALRLRFANARTHSIIRCMPKLPVLEAAGMCSRFVPEYGDRPPLLTWDEKQGKGTPRNLVSYKAEYERPVLVVGVDISDLVADAEGKTFESVEALQTAVDGFTGTIIARIRPGEVKVLLKAR